MKQTSLLIGTVLSLLLLTSVALTARASGPGQGPQFATPTPGADGRILYTVQEGDSCTRISLLTGVPLNQLRSLNNLDESCLLTPGQQLLIGIGGPGGSTATPGPGPTATSAPATPTSIPGSIDVCVLLYDDQNGDGLHQDLEPAIEGGVVSIAGTSGQYSQTGTTVAGTDPICFTKVPIGTYNISVAAPPTYSATTLLNYTLEVKQGDVKTGEVKTGDRVYVDFGAQKAGENTTDSANASSNNNDNTLLGIVGGVLLLVGVGLAFYAWRIYGNKPRQMPPGPPFPR